MTNGNRPHPWQATLPGLCALALGMLMAVLTTGCGVASTPVVAQAKAENFTPVAEPDTPTSEKPDEEGVPKKKEAVEPEAVAMNKPAAADDQDNPFPRRAPLAKILKRDIFPRDADWLNTSGPLKLKDLEGKFVILDFWTYCCINCMHILPELKKLERQFPNELVVIGVHSAKFDGEKDTKNIAEAILRYEIEHPVVNDPDHELWNLIGVQSWPTVVLIDPEGNLVYGRPGEFKAEEFSELLEKAIPYYEKKGKLSRKPLHFEQLAAKRPPTPLRYPGKVLADEAGKRLFISDSNHNRIVITSLDGQLLDIIGAGTMGKTDGDYATATFDHPQGCALDGDTLYVADTENHLLRKVDLKNKQVTTIAGTGQQARFAWPGLEKMLPGGDLPKKWVGPPKLTGINSPWALLIHDKALYIAMAGPHQIWKMPLDESEIGPYAGNGREDIVDGPLLPAEPHALGFSSFAQPSGLSTDGTSLFVADSEGSSIRAVPFNPKANVTTVIGTSGLDGGRLFDFGDVDGARGRAKLQHPLDVVFHNGTIYVADTYNNKIKAVNAKTGAVKTFAGTGKAGKEDAAPTFDEPAGLAYADGKLYVADTNNSLIRTINLADGKVATLAIEGLTPPQPPAQDTPPDFSNAATENLAKTSVKPVDGKVTLKVQLKLPTGWKINSLAPAIYYVAEASDAKLIDAAALGKKRLETPAAEFDVVLPVKPGETSATVSMNYYYCQNDESGVCKIGSVVFTVPLDVAETAANSEVLLSHTVAE